MDRLTKDTKPVLKAILYSGITLYFLYEIAWSLWTPVHDEFETMEQWFIGRIIDFIICYILSSTSILLSQLIIKKTRLLPIAQQSSSLVLLLFSGNLTFSFYAMWIQTKIQELEGLSSCDLRTIVFTTFILATLNTLFCLIYSIKKLTEQISDNQERLSEEKRAHLTTKLNLIQAYINPHFLFNALSSLIGLITKSPEKAIKFTEGLSSVLRYMVSNRYTSLVPIIDDLNNAVNFTSLIQMRFGDQIRLEISDSVYNLHSATICPGTIQMLIENAIKHNQHSSESPLIIKIYLDHNNLIISNNYNPIFQNSNNFKTGNNSLNALWKAAQKKEPQFCLDGEEWKVTITL